MESQKATSPFHPTNDPLEERQFFVLFVFTQRAIGIVPV